MASPFHAAGGGGTAGGGAVPADELVRRQRAKTHAGWLYKIGGFIKSWKRRYWILKNSELYYFEGKQEFQSGDSPKGSFPIRGAVVAVIARAAHDKDSCFGVTPVTEKRQYVMYADDDRQRAEWIGALLEAGGIGEFERAVATATATAAPTANSATAAASATGTAVGGAPVAAAIPLGRSSVTTHQFGASTGIAADSKIVKEGFLLKQTGTIMKAWKIRYFVLTTTHLIYYKPRKQLVSAYTEADKHWNIPLAAGAGLQTEPLSAYDRQWCFSVTQGGDRYPMVASDRTDLESWWHAIRGVIKTLRDGPNAAAAAAAKPRTAPTLMSASDQDAKAFADKQRKSDAAAAAKFASNPIATTPVPVAPGSSPSHHHHHHHHSHHRTGSTGPPPVSSTPPANPTVLNPLMGSDPGDKAGKPPRSVRATSSTDSSPAHKAAAAAAGSGGRTPTRGGSSTPTVSDSESGSDADTAPTASGNSASHGAAESRFDGLLFKFDDKELSEAKMWKRRFCRVYSHTRTFSYWRSEREASGKSASKASKDIALSASQVVYETTLDCERSKEKKTVFSITTQVGPSKQTGGTVQLKKVLFAGENKFIVDKWVSLLSALTPQPAPDEDDSKTDRKSAPAATAAAAAANDPDAEKKAAYAKSVMEDPNSLEAKMLLALNSDIDKFVAFRRTSVDLIKSRIAATDYLLYYFQLFGSESGVRFWSAVLDSLPDSAAAKRAELTALYRQLEDILVAENKAHAPSPHHAASPTATATATATAAPSTTAGGSKSGESELPKAGTTLRRMTTLEQAAQHMINELRRTQTKANPTAAATATATAASPKTASTATAAAPSKPAPVSATSEDLKRRQLQRVAELEANAAAEAAASEARTRQQSTVVVDVEVWEKRHKREIVSLLSNLHEVYPARCAKGAFTPAVSASASAAADEWPNAVKHSFHKALMVVHPDKHAQAAPHEQMLAAQLFQTLTKAYGRFKKLLDPK